MRAGWAAILLYAGLSCATPQRFPRSVPQNFPRAETSSDPSCPDGFFCEQQSCPRDVVCPGDEECVNFEGHFACAPRGLKWCALNPTSLEAVGCSGDGGSCCVSLMAHSHGNCYFSNAVCCDFPSIQCTVGKLCNACRPDQKCGDNQCVDSDASTTTTTTKTTSSTMRTSVPPRNTTTTSTSKTTSHESTSTTKTTTTSKTTSKTTTQTSSSTTKSSTSTSSTSSSTQPTPTIVREIGSFTFSACLADSTDDQVLVADSDSSTTGMTPERCVELARDGAWRYAGVEYSSECYVGNTIHSSDNDPKDDCDMVCSGNDNQLCGGRNRIQVYEDSSWKDPTLDELADTIRQYNASIAATRQVIDDYNEHLAMLQDTMDPSSSSRSKRADSPYEEIELQILNDQSAAEKASSSLADARAEGERMLRLGRQLDTLNNNNPYVPLEALEEFEAVATELAQQLTYVVDDLAYNVREIGSAISTGAQPVIDIITSLATVETAIAKIGLPAVVGVATGFFLAMTSLLALFVGTDQPTSTTTTTTVTATTTTTTSSSTTSCTATAVTTPVVIFTKEGTSLVEFKELISDFPNNEDSIQLTESWQPSFMYVGLIDLCNAEQLSINPVVESWAVDALLDVEGVEAEDTPASKISTDTKKPRSPKAKSSSDDQAKQRNTERNVPTDGSTFVQQSRSPGHLQWLSQVSRYTKLNGNYYSFDDLIYDDVGDITGDYLPLIYVVDTGFQNDHPDFGSRVFAHLAVDDTGTTLIDQLPAENAHGTCMTSLAGGSFSGMGKRARIVTVQLEVQTRGVTPQVRLSRALWLLMRVYNHALNNGGEANAVVTMSFGAPKAALSWANVNLPLPDPSSTNVFDTAFGWFWAHGISTVASAGNDEGKGYSNTITDLSYALPRGAGGTNTPLIVVGNAQYDNERYRTSNYRDSGSRGILSVYNVGTDVECGVLNSEWAVEAGGSSQATAITAGMVAYYLTQPALKEQFMASGLEEFARNVKRHVVDTATTYKWGGCCWADNIPRAALGDVVRCFGGQEGRPEIQTPRGAVTDHRLVTTGITEGTTVVTSSLPACWDLN
ncbi:hypothetical protein BJX70DRAFT_405543 [Aspergillus crustosus]